MQYILQSFDPYSCIEQYNDLILKYKAHVIILSSVLLYIQTLRHYSVGDTEPVSSLVLYKNISIQISGKCWRTSL